MSKSFYPRLAGPAALLLLLASSARAIPSFDKENAVLVTSAAIQAVTGAFPAQRVYYIRASTQVFSAITADGVALVEEPGVRLSSRTVPSLPIAVSSITGLSILPLNAGGFRMAYSVIGTTGTFRIHTATSADGLAWANDTGTAVSVGSTTFAGYPSLVKLASNDWAMYYIQSAVAASSNPAHFQIFAARSSNEGLNWSTGPVVVAARAGQVSAAKLTNGRVRLYYTAPLTGGTTNTLVLSALSANTDGASFSLESGIRLSTSPGTIISPFVTRTTDTFRWRMYYDFSPVSLSTGDAFSATANAPDPQAINPSSVLITRAPPNSTITGEIFAPGVTAELRMSGQIAIPGAGLVVADDQSLTTTFATQGAATGLWDLALTNPNGLTTVLPLFYLVDFPGGSVVLTDNLLRPRTGAQTKIDITIYNAGHVTAKLYTLDGRFISTLGDFDQPAGTFTLNWNGKTSQGHTVASGVYVLRVTGPKLDNTNKIVVIK